MGSPIQSSRYQSRVFMFYGYQNVFIVRKLQHCKFRKRNKYYLIKNWGKSLITSPTTIKRSQQNQAKIIPGCKDKRKSCTCKRLKIFPSSLEIRNETLFLFSSSKESKEKGTSLVYYNQFSGLRRLLESPSNSRIERKVEKTMILSLRLTLDGCQLDMEYAWTLHPRLGQHR